MASEYCDIEVTKMLLETDFPLFKIKVQNQCRPIYYTLSQGHTDWSNCDAYYIPSIYEVHTWLRRSKKLLIEVNMVPDQNFLISIMDMNKVLCEAVCRAKSYEESLLKGIKESLKILKDHEGNSESR